MRKAPKITIFMCLVISQCIQTMEHSLVTLEQVSPFCKDIYQEEVYKGSICSLLIPALEDITTQRAWTDLHSSLFIFPLLLERTALKKSSLVLILPAELKGLSPIAELAPWVEGARVMLSWASAYFRFSELGNVDVRILQIPYTKKDEFKLINQAAYLLLSLPLIDEGKTVEEKMARRIFQLADITVRPEYSTMQFNAYTSKPVTSKLAFPPKQIISPQLDPLSEGKQRIVITGGAGFIGSHVAKALLKEGHQVIVLDNLRCSTKNNIADILKHKNFYFKCFDVTKPFEIKGPINGVIHLASVPSPQFYYTLPRQTLASGLNGTKTALDLAYKKKARFLFTSTSEVYGDPEINPQPENYPGSVDPIGKRSQYDQSKRGAETLIKLYYQRYGIDVRIARIFNTYGPYMGLNDGRVVTNFIKAALKYKPMVAFGTGNQTRSFAYIDDTVEGILKLFNSEEITPQTDLEDRVFNIGNPHEFTIYQLASLVNTLSQKYLQHTIPIEFASPIDPTDPKVRCPNITRAKKILGFSPCIDLTEGLEKTFIFFIKAYKAKDIIV